MVNEGLKAFLQAKTSYGPKKTSLEVTEEFGKKQRLGFCSARSGARRSSGFAEI
jgi:hypothetical protein